VFESAFKVAIAGNRIMLRVFGSTGSGLMLLAKQDAQHLLQLLQAKETGSVNCYNGGKLEATLEVAGEGDGHHMLTAVDRAGRDESYPVDLTGGVMFRATCAYDGQMPQLITDLSRAIATIPE